MKIEVRGKIPVTSDELRKIEEVSQNKFRSSKILFEKPKHRRSTYDPATKSFESYMEANEQ